MKNRNPRLWELFTYLVFGVGTTLVNLVAFKLCNLAFGVSWYLVNNFLAWIVAVAFAYITNKLWVFSSKSWARQVVVPELLSFVGARVASFFVEEGGLWLLVSVLGGGTRLTVTLLGYTISGTMTSKMILAVFVVIINYFFSKFIIFRKKGAPSADNAKPHNPD